MCLLAVCLSSLEKCLFRSLPFFDWVVSFDGIELHELLYILEINPLSVVSFANIFSHSVCCLFILFMVSFAVQKLLSLIRTHLFIFAYVSFNQEDITKKNYCCDSCQSYYCDLRPRVFCLFLPQGVL